MLMDLVTVPCSSVLPSPFTAATRQPTQRCNAPSDRPARWPAIICRGQPAMPCQSVPTIHDRQRPSEHLVGQRPLQIYICACVLHPSHAVYMSSVGFLESRWAGDGIQDMIQRKSSVLLRVTSSALCQLLTSRTYPHAHHTNRKSSHLRSITSSQVRIQYESPASHLGTAGSVHVNPFQRHLRCNPESTTRDSIARRSYQTHASHHHRDPFFLFLHGP